MATKLNISQQLRQRLVITPQLRQAISLLQLNHLSLVKRLQQELNENPLLEDKKLESKKRKDEYLYKTSSKNKQHEELPSLEQTLTNKKDLKKYLKEQVSFLNHQGIEKEVLHYLIGNIDSKGYLQIDENNIYKKFNIDKFKLEELIKSLQSLEPHGIAARDLAECLLLQLQAKGKENSLSAIIVKNYLSLLEKQEYQKIADLEDRTIEEIFSAIEYLQKLTPSPGLSFSNESARYIVPDVYIEKKGDKYTIQMNDEGIPDLRLSSYYVEMMSSKNIPKEQKEYLKEKLKSANWLIRCLMQRKQTIYKVTESLLDFQKDFFEQGEKALKPLVLRQVAKDIGVHESTVSRITNGKYIDTPRGVYEMKYFFSSKVGDISSVAIKQKIEELLNKESKEKPLSDQKIADLLNDQGCMIARRTVAKYRESLGIPSSNKRKKVF